MARSKQFDPDEALERAMYVFWRQGYANTTMDALVKATGVVRASLYSTFGNKAALFRRALDLYGVRRASHVDRQSAPGQMVRQYLEAALADAADPRQPPGCLLFAATAEYAALDDETRAAIDQHMARVEGFFGACVARIVPEEARRRATNVLVGANAAVFTLARTGASEAQLRDIVDAALDAIEPPIGARSV